MDHSCYLCLVFVMLSNLFIAALWSPAGKWPTSWLLFVMLNCVLSLSPYNILGHVWYLIVSDLCRLIEFDMVYLVQCNGRGYLCKITYLCDDGLTNIVKSQCYLLAMQISVI